MSHLCDSTVAGPATRRDNALASKCEYPPFPYPPRLNCNSIESRDTVLKEGVPSWGVSHFVEFPHRPGALQAIFTSRKLNATFCPNHLYQSDCLACQGHSREEGAFNSSHRKQLFEVLSSKMFLPRWRRGPLHVHENDKMSHRDGVVQMLVLFR